MPLPGLLRLKAIAVRVLAVEIAILGSELTSLDILVSELSHASYMSPHPTPPEDRPTTNALQTLIRLELIGEEIWYTGKFNCSSILNLRFILLWLRSNFLDQRQL